MDKTENIEKIIQDLGDRVKEMERKNIALSKELRELRKKVEFNTHLLVEEYG